MLGDEDAVSLLGRVGPASIVDARQLFEPASENRDGVTEQQDPVFRLVESLGQRARLATDLLAQQRAQSRRRLGDDPAGEVRRRFE